MKGGFGNVKTRGGVKISSESEKRVRGRKRRETDKSGIALIIPIVPESQHELVDGLGHFGDTEFSLEGNVAEAEARKALYKTSSIVRIPR